ncbi:hypothetical protein M758_7G181500 [Ceratodon purpureus]|uniref:Uncharacterized protein n=1 Tax=Ceratodon purpureus TaxID=3225 RepID=A0A8T0HCM8_CERPU|nr:hypothetical protein KC19_7G183800 [Ceratodon purpureus]KAG0611984.1 hypothetical protein M758_7G181500 [Ceratodon purpureus]
MVSILFALTIGLNKVVTTFNIQWDVDVPESESGDKFSPSKEVNNCGTIASAATL